MLSSKMIFLFHKFFHIARFGSLAFYQKKNDCIAQYDQNNKAAITLWKHFFFVYFTFLILFPLVLYIHIYFLFLVPFFSLFLPNYESFVVRKTTFVEFYFSVAFAFILLFLRVFILLNLFFRCYMCWFLNELH